MYFDRFDICAAYHLFWTRYHEGQWSYGYRKLSQLAQLDYRPGLTTANGHSFENENVREIYRGLYRTHVLCK